MLEEEGQPCREITSVMMTTSGYLTSSREGRLPESKPPQNRDFFEPILATEKSLKKKIPTMKKIVEGVKKIDKGSKSDTDENQPELFANPDKISIRHAMNGESIVKKISKDKSRHRKKEKLKASLAANGETQKLNIFKSKMTKHKHKLTKKLKQKHRQRMAEVEAAGLDQIDSEEDFDEPSNLKSTLDIAPVISAKSKKKHKAQVAVLLQKKRAAQAEKKIPPLSKSAKRKLDAASSLIFNSKLPDPSALEVTGVPLRKNKRGRPRKHIADIPIGPSGLREPPLSMMKIKKSHMEPEVTSLIPDISLSVKQPPPNFDLLMRLPAQPGLIPTGFAPSAASRYVEITVKHGELFLL